MDKTEIDRLFTMLDSKDGEMQNLGIKAMMPKIHIPKNEDDKKKVVDMLKSDLCIQAFELGQQYGREIQEKITGKWQPSYRELKTLES
jgi:hypothetical protein